MNSHGLGALDWSLNPHNPETPRDSISPSEDVFSYLMLTAPSERLRHGRFTLDACMSYMLVLVTLCMQGVLLTCIYGEVVHKNLNWRASILNTGHDWNLIQPKKECNDGKSLCTMENGTYTCAPPSVQLIGRWHDLDLNNDEVWTHEEVIKARDDLKCKYAVDPLEVFNVLIALIKEREEHIWLHDDIKHGKAIPKTYFTYIMGDVAMCGYRNGDMCGNLMKKGFFDVPLKTGKVPRVGGTVSEAMAYCQDLLAPRGLCERILPSAYSTWKIESVQECQDPEFSKFVYKDPSDGSIKSLLEVDYDAREDYAKAKTVKFMTYKGFIIFMWMVLCVSNIREVGKGVAWVFQIPVGPNTQQDVEAAHHSGHAPAVHTMSFRHRIVLFFVFGFRVFMLFVLLYVGLTFLGRQNDYIDLLLDGVALVFIVEVAEILYRHVLRQDVRKDAEDRDPVEIVKIGLRGLTSKPDLMDMLWFLFVAACATAFVIWYTFIIVHPIHDALQCTCLNEGAKCREASTFNKNFWDNYWAVDVPNSLQSIASLKEKAETQNLLAVDFRKEFQTNMWAMKHHIQHHELGWKLSHPA